MPGAIRGPAGGAGGVPQGKCRGAAGQQAGGPAPATQAGGGGGGRGGGGFYISSPARLFFIKRLFLSVKLRGLVIVRFCRWYRELRRRVLCWLEPDWDDVGFTLWWKGVISRWRDRRYSYFAVVGKDRDLVKLARYMIGDIRRHVRWVKDVNDWRHYQGAIWGLEELLRFHAKKQYNRPIRRWWLR